MKRLPKVIKEGMSHVVWTFVLKLIGLDVALVFLATWIIHSIVAQFGASHLPLSFYVLLAILMFCAVTSFGVLVVLLHGRQKSAGEVRPRFIFAIGANVWIYDRTVDRTLFFLLGQILNRSTPSVALNWEATYRIGVATEQMTAFWLRAPYTVQVGKEQLTVLNSDLLTVKTAETPIPTGGCVNGRILMTVEGDRSNQIKASSFQIDVTCKDIDGTAYHASFIPSTGPSPWLLTHAFENASRILEASSNDTPQLKPEDD